MKAILTQLKALNCRESSKTYKLNTILKKSCQKYWHDRRVLRRRMAERKRHQWLNSTGRSKH